MTSHPICHVLLVKQIAGPYFAQGEGITQSHEARGSSGGTGGSPQSWSATDGQGKEGKEQEKKMEGGKCICAYNVTSYT